MPPRTTVTPLDLANLKADITEEQMKIRHEQRGELSTKLLIVDNLSVEQKLTNQTIQTMQKTLYTHQEYTKSEFQELRKEMRESNEKIIARLDKITGGFATKEDHEKNSKRIEVLEQDKWSIGKWAITLVVAIALSGTAIDKFI